MLFRFGLALLKAFEAPLRGCRSFEEAVMLMKDGMRADAKATDPDKLLVLAFGEIGGRPPADIHPGDAIDTTP